MMNGKETSRRKFLRSGSALAGFFILPSGLRANSPNGRLQSAHIGVGGKGSVDTAQIAAHPKTQVVALCDVDRNSLEGRGRKQKTNPKERYPGAKKFQDYREMFNAMGDKVDIVSVSTPDHTHYPATMKAMELGKHVYTQKPLTNNLAEALLNCPIVTRFVRLYLRLKSSLHEVRRSRSHSCAGVLFKG